MTMPDVRELVPHSGRMVLLDRVLSADDDNLCAEVRIHAGSMLAGEEGVGAWVGIEYMAQAIAAHAGWLALQRGEAVKVGFLLGSRKYASSVPLFATGSVLLVHVQRVLQGENGLGAFDCRIDVAGGASAVGTATVTVFQPDNVNQFLKDGNAV
ncbi:3-hydroxylacyl-ACP dehydratase [Duganella sp. BJB488]|uniref:ApeP family dehydratase n=1 Tax=unclassified Duganella TaxID=2636909 RepID=UPI000E35102A|nr:MULTISPECIES: hotdog family protein [unclassified Duganella]RFP11606.1 3-hydroxylacyl-ACP dehydratase [Duganella sp. BJB489]RFP15680.1 3-hydroxylacyl-ACP dehydratase [Duganella sp. BJB488]RFP30627.1 3-hydroxylacyl-ACP dehydratase [Duganella sp. BJB480]